MINRILLILPFVYVGLFAESTVLSTVINKTIAQHDVVCVFIDCASGGVIAPDTAAAQTRYTPCSSFKIWNTLIGAECGIIQSADTPFYTWDSVSRFLPEWNRNLTFKEAFGVSCVPAFQALARNIGTERMAKWIAVLSYGDGDIASGIDDFWLPRKGKKSIRISPLEQAQLIRKLVNQELPFSRQSQDLLREVMMVEKTEQGVWYGKTGSGEDVGGKGGLRIGWFVGYVTSNNQCYSFACLVQGKSVSGKDAKAIIETILRKSALL